MSVTTAPPSTGHRVPGLAPATAAVLASAATTPAAPGRRPDAGTALLATAAGPERGAAALTAWLHAHRTDTVAAWRPGLLAPGLAGHWVALHTAAGTWPALAPLAAAAGAALRRALTTTGPPPGPTTWTHYDVVDGPAGVVLAAAAVLRSGSGHAHAGAVLREALRRLVERCDEHLSGLVVRGYAGHPQCGWNQDRINTGLAHGVAGVVLALATGLDALDVPDPAVTASTAAALRRTATWLADRRLPHPDGLLGWPLGVDADLASARTTGRQSWCYGTPGVSWALWRAGVTLGDAGLREHATASFCSYLDHVDADRQLDGAGLCCGSAGIALISDGFARHAGLPGAAALRDRMARRTVDLLRPDPGPDPDALLAGAAGALAVVAALDTGATWTVALGAAA